MADATETQVEKEPWTRRRTASVLRSYSGVIGGVLAGIGGSGLVSLLAKRKMSTVELVLAIACSALGWFLVGTGVADERSAGRRQLLKRQSPTRSQVASDERPKADQTRNIPRNILDLVEQGRIVLARGSNIPLALPPPLPQGAPMTVSQALSELRDED